MRVNGFMVGASLVVDRMRTGSSPPAGVSSVGRYASRGRRYCTRQRASPNQLTVSSA